jgi:hypothetical protein
MHNLVICVHIFFSLWSLDYVIHNSMLFSAY